MKLRGEADGWLSDLDGMGEEMSLAFYNILDEDQQRRAKVPVVVTAPESCRFRSPLSIHGPTSSTWR